MQTAPTILGILTHQSTTHPEFVFSRIYRHLFNPDFYRLAERHWQHKCAATRTRTRVESSFPEVLDDREIAATIELLRQEKYRLRSSCRNSRPGSSACMDARLADVVAYLLSAMLSRYQSKSMPEPLEQLHQLCRSLPRQVELARQEVPDPMVDFSVWSHMVLPQISERIADGRFVNLLKMLVSAGFASHWDDQLTFSEEPSGSPLSELFRELSRKAMKAKAAIDLSLGYGHTLGYGKTLILLRSGDRTEEPSASGETPFGLYGSDRSSPETLDLWGYRLQLQGSSWLLKVDPKQQKKLLAYFTSSENNWARGWLISAGIGRILTVYRTELHAWQRYYGLASNYEPQLRHFAYFHRRSLLATLAQKLRLSYQQTKERFRDVECPGGLAWVDPAGRSYAYQPAPKASLVMNSFNGPWDGTTMADIDRLPPTWNRKL